MKIKHILPMASIIARRSIVEIARIAMRKGLIKPQRANRVLIQQSLAINEIIERSARYEDEFKA